MGAEGADYLLINPVHAAEPEPPVEDSPYLPTSRRFINPIYIAVEDVAEWDTVDADIREDITATAAPLKESNSSAEPINRNDIFAVKLAALRELFYVAEQDARRREAFAAFIADEGEGLVEFARWCAAQAAAPGRHAGRGAEVDDETVRFYMWMQFIADEQRRAAQQRAVDAGMDIGIITDLAVGVHPGGADAATLSDVLVQDASVGAPPDQYCSRARTGPSRRGIPTPWPRRVTSRGATCCAPCCATCGGVRVDHILGLFRLFWIPRTGNPAEGVYMNYDHEAMVGVLALEAQRAGAIVVGEDLGTFEPWVQDALRDKGILGTSVLWFESSAPEGSPKRAAQYRNLCSTSVGT